MSVDILIRRMLSVFGSPAHVDEPEEYLKEFTKAVAGFAPDAYAIAATELIRSHEPTNLKPWPSMAAARQAVHDAAESLPKKEIEGEKNKTWTKAALTQADHLIQSDLGRQAADEGWVLSLWDFCREHNRLPRGYEIAGCQRHAKEFDETYRKCVHGGWPESVGLKTLGDMMLARRYQKADLAYGVISDRREIRKEMDLKGLRENSVDAFERPTKGKMYAAGERE